MRWQFVDPNDQEEANWKREVIARIDAWWNEFQEKAEAIDAMFSKKKQWDLVGWMHTHLNSIHANLMWEYGPAILSKGHRLVITPESRQYLRPLVNTILKRAPKLEGWEFYPYRLKESFEQAMHSVIGRTDIDLENTKIHVSIGDCNLVDVTFHVPLLAQKDKGQVQNAAFVALESLLGEESLDKWIGVIGVELLRETSGFQKLLGKKDSTRTLIPISRLPEVVNSLICSIQDQLHPEPHFKWAEKAAWSMWELKPEPASDYFGQEDIYVARSSNPGMWTTAHSQWNFYSERFSRCNETFCYIKLDSTGIDSKEMFQLKTKIEEQIDEVLIPKQLGCHIGGGTGMHYSYIDLALVDLIPSIKLVRKVLQEAKVAKRSWFQFYDTDMRHEWIGVYPTTPPPPIAEEE